MSKKIKVVMYRNKQKQIYRVTGHNHGPSNVCAAVSILLINTHNSIETLTNSEVTVKDSPDGGFLDFSVTNRLEDDAVLLLEAMNLGLQGIAQEYPKDLQIEEVYAC